MGCAWFSVGVGLAGICHPGAWGEGVSELEMQNLAWQRMMPMARENLRKVFSPHVPAGGAAHPLDAAGFKAPPFDATGFVANRFDASGPWSPWW